MKIEQGMRIIDIDFYNISNMTLFLGHAGDSYLTKINLFIPSDALEEGTLDGIEISAVFKRDIDKNENQEIKKEVSINKENNLKELFISGDITKNAHRGYLQFRISKTNADGKVTVANSSLIPYIVEESLNFSNPPSNVDDASLSHVEEAFLKYSSLSKGKIPWPVDSENKIDWGGENQILQSDGKGGLSWVDKLDLESGTAWNAIQNWLDEHPDKANVNLITPQMCLHSFCEENKKSEGDFLEKDEDEKKSIKYRDENGILDLTELVQYTIDKASKEGKIAYFPPGEYGVTSLYITKPVTIMGAGEDRTFFHEVDARQQVNDDGGTADTNENGEPVDSEIETNTNDETSGDIDVEDDSSENETSNNEVIIEPDEEVVKGCKEIFQDYIFPDRSNSAIIVVALDKETTPSRDASKHNHDFLKRCRISNLTICSLGVYSPWYKTNNYVKAVMGKDIDIKTTTETNSQDYWYLKGNDGKDYKIRKYCIYNKKDKKWYKTEGKDSDYQKNGLELRSKNNETIIENITVTRVGGNGIRITTGCYGCRLFNIKTYYNALHGVRHEGYGTFISNLTTNQNRKSGFILYGGAGQFSNIRSWGNFEHGVLMVHDPHSCMLTNINAQQNHGCGLRMESGYDNVITNFQSMANNFSGSFSGITMEELENKLEYDASGNVVKIPADVSTFYFYGNDIPENFYKNPYTDTRGSGFYINGNNNIIQGSDVRASWEPAWLAIEKYGVYVTGEAYNNKIDILCSEGENKSKTHLGENTLFNIYKTKIFTIIYKDIIYNDKGKLVEWEKNSLNELVKKEFSEPLPKGYEKKSFDKSITLHSLNESNDINIIYKGEEEEEINFDYLGGYIVTKNNLANLSNITQKDALWEKYRQWYDHNFRCAIIDLDKHPNKSFFINAHGGETALAYCFYNEKGEKLKNCANKDGYLADVRDIIISPEKAKWLIINNKDGFLTIKDPINGTNQYYKIDELICTVENESDEISSYTWKKKGKADGFVIQNNSNSSISPVEPESEKFIPLKSKILEDYKDSLSYEYKSGKERKSYIIDRTVLPRLEQKINESKEELVDSIGKIINITEIAPSQLSLEKGYYYFDLTEDTQNGENTNAVTVAVTVANTSYDYTNNRFKKLFKIESDSVAIECFDYDSNSKIYRINGTAAQLIDFLSEGIEDTTY